MKKTAFTLAEVLITLGIIGVVAALVMPSLIANYKEKQTVVRLKKAYSILSQAYQRAVNDNGTPDNWGLVTGKPGGNIILGNLAPYLNIQENCGTDPGCFPSSGYKYLSGPASPAPTADMAKAVLADGTSIYLTVVDATCSSNLGNSPMLANYCGWIYVDINGLKSPNQVGKDLFVFTVTRSGIVPNGVQDETTYPFNSSCQTNSNGVGCTAWVIFNENLDYLHCNDLSWEGKTRCN